MTMALEGGEWSAARPGRTLPPGKTGYPFHSRLGGPHGRSGRAENLVPTGIRSRTVQPVAQSLYRLSYPTHTDTITTKYKIIILLTSGSSNAASLFDRCVVCTYLEKCRIQTKPDSGLRSSFRQSLQEKRIALHLGQDRFLYNILPFTINHS